MLLINIFNKSSSLIIITSKEIYLQGKANYCLGNAVGSA